MNPLDLEKTFKNVTPIMIERHGVESPYSNIDREILTIGNLAIITRDKMRCEYTGMGLGCEYSGHGIFKELTQLQLAEIYQHLWTKRSGPERERAFTPKAEKEHNILSSRKSFNRRKMKRYQNLQKKAVPAGNEVLRNIQLQYQ